MKEKLEQHEDSRRGKEREREGEGEKAEKRGNQNPPPTPPPSISSLIEGVLLDVCVGARDVSFGLVVSEIADE